jgi:hypothetical protein
MRQFDQELLVLSASLANQGTVAEPEVLQLPHEPDIDVGATQGRIARTVGAGTEEVRVRLLERIRSLPCEPSVAFRVSAVSTQAVPADKRAY